MYDKNTARHVTDLVADQLEHSSSHNTSIIPSEGFPQFNMNNYQPSQLVIPTGHSKPTYANMIDLESTTQPSKQSLNKTLEMVQRAKNTAASKSQSTLNFSKKSSDSVNGFQRPQEEKQKEKIAIKIPKTQSTLNFSTKSSDSVDGFQRPQEETIAMKIPKSYSFTNKTHSISSGHSEPPNAIKLSYEHKEKLLSQHSELTSSIRNSSSVISGKSFYSLPLKEPLPIPKQNRVLPESIYKPHNFHSKKTEDENSALKSLRQWKNRNLQTTDRIQEIPQKRAKPEEFTDSKAEKPHKKLQTTQQLINNIIEEQQRRTQEKIIDAKQEAQKREAAEKKYRESLWSTTSQTSKISEARLKEHQRKQRFQLRYDLSDFYRYILNLDLFNLESKSEDFLPIPIAFDDGQDYINSFKPVFLEELKGDISSSARQINFSKASLTSLRLYSMKDNLVYISPERDFDTSRPAFQFSFKPDDLVLLMLYEEGALPSSYSTATKPTIPYLLGICEFDIRNDKKVSHQLMIKISPEYEHFFSSENSNYYYIVYIETLTTLTREYRMIALAEFMDLAEFILLPRTNSHTDDLQVPLEFWDTIGRMFNESQFRAILDICSKFRGISLLQGPPGTGKTQTVMGILSAFLLSKGLTTLKPHVLVCAPSNGAVDELAYRVVKQGLIDSKGMRRTDLSCVRVGHWNRDHVELKQRNPNDRKEPPKEVKSISLGELVSNRIRGEGLIDKSVLIHEVKNELNKVDKALTSAKAKSDSLLIQDLINKRSDLQNNLFRYKHEKLQTEDKKRHFQQEILNKADIVFCTLSGAGSREISQILHKFDYVIIDEACQSVELSSLIPLQYGGQIVVMVGDPQQLPSTTFSSKSKRAGYDTSLFERLMKGGCPMFMLEIQYRMSPEIREFPSYYFYNNRLLDADTTLNRSKPAWMPNLPCWFFNHLGSRESRTEDETSVSNYPEAALIVEIYEKLRPVHGTKLDIGVITPYRKQVRLIRNLLDEKFQSTHRKDIEVNTVDGFQGREKNLIIFSCVRARGSVGFLADRRRMNVAITRARYSIWVVGKTDTLVRNRDWQEYVKYMKSREWYSDVKDIGDVIRVFQDKENRMDIDREYQPVMQIVERKGYPEDVIGSFVRPKRQSMQDLKDAIEEDYKEGLKELVKHTKTQDRQKVQAIQESQPYRPHSTTEQQVQHSVNTQIKSQDSSRIHQIPPYKTSTESLKPLLKTPTESLKPLLKTPTESQKPLLKTPTESFKPLLKTPTESQKPLLKTPTESFKPLLKTPSESFKPLSKKPSELLKSNSKTSSEVGLNCPNLIIKKSHEESKKLSGKFQPSISSQKPRVKKPDRFDVFEFTKSLNK